MKQRKRSVFLGAVFIMTACSLIDSRADTVVMNSGEKRKGVVVEEYADRIVLSTLDGEENIFQKDIRQLVFDLEEQNFTSLGDFYQDRRMFDKAYYYYKKALDVNPSYKKAKDGLSYVETHMRNISRMRKLDQIQRLNEGNMGRVAKTTAAADSGTEDQVRSVLGIVLKNVRGSFEVEDVVPASPAEEAGLRKGDVLFSAWGRAVSYIEPKELMEKLTSTMVMDVQLTIERSYTMDVDGPVESRGYVLGMKLGFSEMEGLMVKGVEKGSIAARTGIKEGDVITDIEEESSRYMPIKEVVRAINSRKGKTLSLSIRRDVVIWKKFK